MRCDEVVRELAAPTDARDRAAMAEHLAACSACAEWARRADRLDQVWEATRPSEPSPEAWDAVWANIAQALPCPPAARHEDAAASGPRPSLNGSGVKVLAHPSPAPAAPRPGGRSWRLGAIALVGLSQAAAILVALGLAWTPPPRPDGPRDARSGIAGEPVRLIPVAIRAATPVKVEAEIQEGRLMLIPAEGVAAWVVAERSDGMIPGIGGVVRAVVATARVVDLTPPEWNFGSDGGLVILNAMESIATPQVAVR